MGGQGSQHMYYEYQLGDWKDMWWYDETPEGDYERGIIWDVFDSLSQVNATYTRGDDYLRQVINIIEGKIESVLSNNAIGTGSDMPSVFTEYYNNNILKNFISNITSDVSIFNNILDDISEHAGNFEDLDIAINEYVEEKNDYELNKVTSRNIPAFRIQMRNSGSVFTSGFFAGIGNILSDHIEGIRDIEESIRTKSLSTKRSMYYTFAKKLIENPKILFDTEMKRLGLIKDFQYNMLELTKIYGTSLIQNVENAYLAESKSRLADWEIDKKISLDAIQALAYDIAAEGVASMSGAPVMRRTKEDSGVLASISSAVLSGAGIAMALGYGGTPVKGTKGISSSSSSTSNLPSNDFRMNRLIEMR